jgi:hypothetical protein
VGKRAQIIPRMREIKRLCSESELTSGNLIRRSRNNASSGDENLLMLPLAVSLANGDRTASF